MQFDAAALKQQAEALADSLLAWAQSPFFYIQLALIGAAIVVAWIVARFLRRYLQVPREAIEAGTLTLRQRLALAARRLAFPLLTILFLGVATEASTAAVGQSAVLRIAQGLAVVLLIYSASRVFFRSPVVRAFARWVIVPIALLQVFGLLDEVIAYLQGIDATIGNIRFSLYDVARILIFGAILFWLGRLSNESGKQYIRSQEALEIGTREVFAKLFEIALFVVLFFVMLQIMGINLTTLAVLGGAIGVGIGFGLQSIASNFISGLIILLDRSLTVGDYVELEDGRAGTIRELNMRSTILETFDGKDVVVPNETFITTSFTNWTHFDTKQRYSIEFQVAYATDMERLVELLREVVASHPQVLSGPDYPVEEQPDAEISGFGDSGIDVLIEYWMEGVDDGRNRVDADLNMMIWKALKENGVQFPFPQREVRLLNGDKAS